MVRSRAIHVAKPAVMGIGGPMVVARDDNMGIGSATSKEYL